MNRHQDPALQSIAELCRQHGLLWHHCSDSRRCRGNGGLPDTVIVGPGGVLWRELKDGPGHVRPGQVEWKWMLRAANQDWGLWYPSHVRTGQVAEELAALARPRV